MTRSTAVSILLHLYRRPARGGTHPFVALCAALGRRAEQINEALAWLAERGLVDPDRVRLTLEGLAVAVALDAHDEAVRAAAAPPRAEAA